MPTPERDLLRTIGVSSAVLVPPVALLASLKVDLDSDRLLEALIALAIAVLVVVRLQRTVGSLLKAEAQFRQLMAYPGLLAIIKDNKGRYRFMSDKAVANNGLSGTSWYGRTDRQLFDPDTADLRESLDVEARRTGEIQVRTFEVGPSTWHTEKFLLRDLPGWIGVIGVDITDRIRADERGRALEAKLVASDRATAKDARRRAKERAVVRAALRAIRPDDAPATAAAAACRALASVTGFSHAAVVAFEATGPGDVLAFIAHGGWVIEPRPMPIERSDYLRDRARRGPWVERWLADREHPYQYVIDDLAIAGHAYVPIMADGQLVGLLVVGAIDPGAMARLTAWLPALTELAEMYGAVVGPAFLARSSRGAAVAALRGVIGLRSFRTVFQPIVDLRSGATLGYEALTRFDDGTPPDVAFRAARGLGLGDELEFAAVEVALEASRALPAGAWLNINVSPASIAYPNFGKLLASADRELVVEITEHDAVEDYAAFRAAFHGLEGNARLCIDDAGAGFASLRHVVELEPAFVKLDRSLVAGIDRDPARQAAVAGLVHYAGVAGVRLVAEGIEEPGELEVLKALGIVLGQGYLLGRPVPIARAAPRRVRTTARQPTRQRSRAAA